jgi:hypothetical protein
MASTLKPLKIAILGGGPSSFYCASRILSKLPHTSPEGQNIQVHVYDRLWAPHGLVRYGVAPDHPEVKVRIFFTSFFSCTHSLRNICFVTHRLMTFLRRIAHTNLMRQRKTLASASLGTSMSVMRPPSRTPCTFPLRALLPHYTHLIISNGATLPTVLPQLGNASTPALSLVHWYTAHPSNPPPPRLEAMPHMTLLGHGNVSLDIARIMFSPPERLAPLDLPESCRRENKQHKCTAYLDRFTKRTSRGCFYCQGAPRASHVAESGDDSNTRGTPRSSVQCNQTAEQEYWTCFEKVQLPNRRNILHLVARVSSVVPQRLRNIPKSTQQSSTILIN